MIQRYIIWRNNHVGAAYRRAGEAGADASAVQIAPSAAA